MALTDMDTIAYRMEQVEKQLSDISAKFDKLSEFITEARMNDNDVSKEIQVIKEKEIVQDRQIENLRTDVDKLRLEPMKKDANKWQYIVDFIFKSLVAAAVGAMFWFKV